MAQTAPTGNVLDSRGQPDSTSATSSWGRLISVNQQDLEPLDFENSKAEYALGTDASNDIVLKGTAISSSPSNRSEIYELISRYQGENHCTFSRKGLADGPHSVLVEDLSTTGTYVSENRSLVYHGDC